MRFKNVILVLVLLLPFAAAFAKKKPAAPTVPEEQLEQFKYYFYASREALDKEEYDRALVLLHFCEQLNPYDGLTKSNLGRLYAALGREKDAEKTLEEAVRLAPNDCWEPFADFLLRKGDIVSTLRAQIVTEAAHRRNPKDADIADYLLPIYVKRYQWNKAVALMDEIDALRGYNANSALNRYRIYYQMGNRKRAYEEIDRYLKQDPTSLYFLMLKSNIYAMQENFVEVYAIAERIAKTVPLEEEDYQLIKQDKYCAYYISLIKAEEADSLIVAGNIEKAFETYEISLFLLPQNLYTLNNYAYNIAIHGGDIKQAERMSAETLKAEPNNAIYLDTYGWILHLQGQNALASFYLKRALENVKDDFNRKVIQEHLDELEK